MSELAQKIQQFVYFLRQEVCLKPFYACALSNIIAKEQLKVAGKTKSTGSKSEML